MTTLSRPMTEVMKAFGQCWAIGILLMLFLTTAHAQQTVYDDRLANGWASYSWAAVKFGCAAPVHGGKDAISVTVAAGSYGALELRTGAFDAARYRGITFWINGGTVGGQDHLVVKASVDGKQQGRVGIPKLTANTWTQITVPLADLGVATAARMTGFLIQQDSPNVAPTFFVDDVQLTASDTPAATAFHIHHGPATPLAFTGVNLSGGEFGSPQPGKPSRYGTNYTYPTDTELDYFAAKGVNVIRFPFHWADLQTVQMQPLDLEVLIRLKSVVTAATGRGMNVILDPHDYARYYGQVIGGPEVPDDAFADFWGRLAGQFKANPRVWFGLMNEPHDMPKEQWLGAANAAIAAIRKSGAANLILVPGIAWTGAHSWVSSGNGDAMLNVKDPQNHYIFEAHQYLDADSSGSHPTVVSTTIGAERLQQFTLWCRLHHQRAFLGEFGAAASPDAAQATEKMLDFMEQNRDVWVGFTWWSAGTWWGDYMFSIEPKDGQDRPQLSYLQPHLQQTPIKSMQKSSPSHR
jgi:endoglucanase